MSRFIAWVLATLVLGTAAFAQTPPATGEDEVALIKRGAAAYDENKPDEAARLLKIAVDAPAFKLINEDGQWIAQRTLASAAYDTKDYQVSARAARAATVYPKSNGDDWEMRIWAAEAISDKTDVVIAMTTLATKWPDRMNRFKLGYVSQTIDDVKVNPGGEELGTWLLQALFAASWKPYDAVPTDVDWMWVKLIRSLVKWQQIDEARSVAGRIENPSALREIQIGKEFDEIVAADPGRFDSDKASERFVLTASKWATDHPDQLVAVIDAAHALYAVDRQSEALGLLDDAKARIVKHGKEAFKDFDDKYNWLLDTRSRVLIALGRREEGLAELVLGANRKEYGTTNISQLLNLANAYNRIGRPADALATLARADLKNASGYGRMVYGTARACAYAQLQDAKGLKDAMSFVDIHSGDSPGGKIEAQLCAGDVEGAAQYAIAQLQNPEGRSNIIMALQDYSLPRQAVSSAFERSMRERWEALLQRDDVRRAIEPYGRIIRFKTIE